VELTPLIMKVALLGAEWVLWLLLILSAVSFTIAVEQALYFYKSRLQVLEVSDRFQKTLYRDGLDSARKLLKDKENSPQARIVLAGLDEASTGKEAVENAMTARQTVEKARMERYLNFLSTLGNNAPFIGLFGTVLGIMGAFYKLHVNIVGGTSVVMKDISEALVATAVGLFVAIPAVIFNNIFRQKIRRTLADVNVLGSILFNYLESGKTKEISVD
jgi:biopolymer transport protein ExbB/TolQ